MTGSPMSEYGYPAPYGAAPPRVRTSVAGLGLAATILLALDAALALLAIGFFAWRHSLLGKLLDDPNSVGPNRLHDADQASRGALGWFFILTAATIVVFLCWFRTARTNAEAYAPNHGTLGVGWSIGGWFIPVAALVLPSLVARDIYRGTMSGGKKKPMAGGQITGWWWGAYVIFWIMGMVVTVAAGQARNATDAEDHIRRLQAAVAAGVFALAVGAVAAVLAIAYVRTITKAQNARNREGVWYGGPGQYGMPYGYGAPMPGYPMPMPIPVQPPTSHAFGAPSRPPVYQMQMPMPTQDAFPVRDRIPFADPQVAETQTADVRDVEPPKEPGDRLKPPS